MAVYIESNKSNRAKEYAKDGNINKSKQILESELYSSVFRHSDIHHEEEPVLKEINNAVYDILYDIDIIESELITCATNIALLLSSINKRLSNVENDIQKEDDRLQDMNMLCGKNSDFEISESLNEKDFVGNFSFDNGVFTPEITENIEVNSKVISVIGNGYEGNNYVYNNGFIKDVIDTSNKLFMTDGNIETFYEYSRINASIESIAFPLVNFDNENVKCHIILEATDPISRLEIRSALSGLTITEISVSENGSVFNIVSNKSFSVNEKSMNYKDPDYIHGSGILCFPSSRFIKIGLESKESLSEKIAFVATQINIK